MIDVTGVATPRFLRLATQELFVHSSVLYSVFFSMTQFGISFVLMAAEGQYELLWMIFIGCGLAAAALYTAAYPADKKTFPLLYQ